VVTFLEDINQDNSFYFSKTPPKHSLTLNQGFTD